MEKNYLITQTTWLNKLMAIVYGCYASYFCVACLFPFTLSIFTLAFLPIVIWISYIVFDSSRELY